MATAAASTTPSPSASAERAVFEAAWPGTTLVSSGSRVAVISARWFAQWCSYTGFPLTSIPLYKKDNEAYARIKAQELLSSAAPNSRPSTLSNADIQRSDDKLQLALNIEEGRDFYCIALDAYAVLVSLYSSSSSSSSSTVGPHFLRSIGLSGVLRRSPCVQLYPTPVVVYPCDPVTGKACHSSTQFTEKEHHAPLVLLLDQSHESSVEVVTAEALYRWASGIGGDELAPTATIAAGEEKDVSSTSIPSSSSSTATSTLTPSPTSGTSAVCTSTIAKTVDWKLFRAYIAVEKTKKELAKEAELAFQQEIGAVDATTTTTTTTGDTNQNPEDGSGNSDAAAGQPAPPASAPAPASASAPASPSASSPTATPVDDSCLPFCKWQLVPSAAAAAKQVSAWSLPKNAHAYALMVETCTDPYSTPPAWPRDVFVSKSTFDPVPGMLVDARDHQRMWYKAKVLDIEPGGLYRVHYLGWSDSNDESIPRSLIEPYDTVTQGLPERKGIKRLGSYGDDDDDSSSLAQRYRGPYGMGVSSYEYRSNVKGHTFPGVCGLQNLGNTCYMNSILQCLSNTVLLTDLFLDTPRIQALINPKSPLGRQGELAKAYSKWLEEMWSGQYTVVNPQAFRSILVKNTAFDGYQQHDSSELLNHVLDCLHEETNERTTKPLTSTVESKGRPDFEVASEAWRVHELRNKSVIVETFAGQIKSTKVCRECNSKSVTFDPFMSLLVPVPSAEAESTTRTITVVRTSPSLTVNDISVGLGPNASVKDLFGVLAPRFTPPLMVKRLVARTLDRSEPMNESLPVDSARGAIYVYEVEPNALCDPANGKAVFVPVVTKAIGPNALPLYIALPKKYPGALIQNLYPEFAKLLAHVHGFPQHPQKLPSSTSTSSSSRSHYGGGPGAVSRSSGGGSGSGGVGVGLNVFSDVDMDEETSATGAGIFFRPGAVQPAKHTHAHAHSKNNSNSNSNSWSRGDGDYFAGGRRNDGDDDEFRGDVEYYDSSPKPPPPEPPSPAAPPSKPKVAPTAPESFDSEPENGGGDDRDDEEDNSQTLQKATAAAATATFVRPYSGNNDSYGFSVHDAYNTHHPRATVEEETRDDGDDADDDEADEADEAAEGQPSGPSTASSPFRHASQYTAAAAAARAPTSYASAAAAGATAATGAGAGADDMDSYSYDPDLDGKIPSHVLHQLTLDLCEKIAMPGTREALDASAVATVSDDYFSFTVHPLSTDNTKMIEYASMGHASSSITLHWPPGSNKGRKPDPSKFESETMDSVEWKEQQGEEKDEEKKGGPGSGASGSGRRDASPLQEDLGGFDAEQVLLSETPEKLISAYSTSSSSLSGTRQRGGSVSQRDWPATYFSKAPRKAVTEYSYGGYGRSAATTRVDLDACFRAFAVDETLDDSNMAKCSKCNKLTSTKKKLDVFRLPDVLLVCLKRFSTVDHVNYSKNNNPVDYPLLGLDMTQYMAPSARAAHAAMVMKYEALPNMPPLNTRAGELAFQELVAAEPQLHGYPMHSNYEYDLVAVSLHGGTLTGGHYTAYARNFLNGKWYNFDDTHTNEISLDSVQHNGAYVLVYQRRGCTLAVEEAVPHLAPFTIPADAAQGQQGGAAGAGGDDDYDYVQ